MQQANRLGQTFAKAGLHFTHVFSSDLSRAFRTAQSIRDATDAQHEARNPTTSIVQATDLREQDFGYYEGKPFYARNPDSNKSAKETHWEKHKDEAGFQDLESKDSMAKRADSFLDQHLMPVLGGARQERSLTIAIVSHGMLLSSLWKCLFRRQLPNTVTLNPELVATGRPLSLEHLGGWSNTGYLEVELQPTEAQPLASNGPSPMKSAGLQAVKSSLDEAQVSGQTQASSIEIGPERPADAGAAEISQSHAAQNFKMLIKTINGKQHLQGLKRTGGGVGSSKHDEGQKSIQSFFKKRKT